jgi:hypothetical protein
LVQQKRSQLKPSKALAYNNIVCVWFNCRVCWAIVCFVDDPKYRANLACRWADFWLIGNSSTLWPSSLDSSSAGGPFCLNPTAQMLSDGALNSSGCIWYSTSAIAQAFQAWHFHKFYNISITETTYKRTVGVIPSDPSYNDTWALSSNPAAGLLSDQLAAVWQEAVYHAPVTQKSTSSYHNFDFRIYEGTIAKVQTKLPAVRTRCNLWDNVFDNTKFLGVFDHTFHLFVRGLISK